MKAATYEKQLYEQQAQRLSNMSPREGSIASKHSSIPLYSESPPRKPASAYRSREQAKFKSALLEYYHVASSFKLGKKKVDIDLVFDTSTSLTFPKQ